MREVSQKEKNKYYSIYMESRKMIQMILFAKQKQRGRCREQMYRFVTYTIATMYKVGN